MCASMCVCWLLPSNQSLYKQIAGQGNGVGDHRVGRRLKGSTHVPAK